MKALTINQPYAHLIMTGEKLVENRTWATKYRGTLLIHAGKTRKWLDHFKEWKEYPFLDKRAADLDLPVPEDMTLGAIIAVVTLLDCLHSDDIAAGRFDNIYPWIRSHSHVSGPWCWVLADARPLSHPIPCRGSQGLWNFN